MLRQVKQQVRMHLGSDSEEVRRYERSYLREFKDPWVESSKTQLIEKVDSADFVFGGDFHSLAQAQRTHLRVLRSISQVRPVVLALEVFDTDDQVWVDQFQQGKLSEETFLEKINWVERWGFPWENYAPLLTFAREHGHGVLALNQKSRTRSAESLVNRDVHAAEVLTREYCRNSKRLFYVIYGDLHLSRSHLPKELKNRLWKAGVRSSRSVTIFQNAEKIYFELAQRGREMMVDIVSLGRDRFCINTSPPWIPWQSYLQHLEATMDRDLGDPYDHFDYTDQIQRFVDHILDELGISERRFDFLSSLTVLSPWTPRVDRAISEKLSKDEFRMAMTLMTNNRGFVFPKGFIYLATSTINQAADLAGQFLHLQLSERRHCCWDLPKHLEQQIWIQAVGFFCSKLVNPHRKADTVTNLMARLKSSHSGLGREALAIALKHSVEFLTQKQTRFARSLECKPRRKASYLEASRILGTILGERLYLAHRTGLVSRSDLVELMATDVMSQNFSSFYSSVVREMRPFSQGPLETERL